MYNIIYNIEYSYMIFAGYWLIERDTIDNIINNSLSKYLNPLVKYKI